MIVQLTDKIEAYGVYPGDKAAIPAVNIMIHLLINGLRKILSLWFMHAGDKLDKKAKWKMTLDKL